MTPRPEHSTAQHGSSAASRLSFPRKSHQEADAGHNSSLRGQPMMARGSAVLPGVRGDPSELRGTPCQAAVCGGQQAQLFLPPPPSELHIKAAVNNVGRGAQTKPEERSQPFPQQEVPVTKDKSKAGAPGPDSFHPEHRGVHRRESKLSSPRSSRTGHPRPPPHVQRDESSHGPHSPQGSTTAAPGAAQHGAHRSSVLTDCSALTAPPGQKLTAQRGAATPTSTCVQSSVICIP